MEAFQQRAIGHTIIRRSLQQSELEAEWEQHKEQQKLTAQVSSPAYATLTRIGDKEKQSPHQCSASRWDMHPKVHHFHMTPHSLENDPLLKP